MRFLNFECFDICFLRRNEGTQGAETKKRLTRFLFFFKKKKKKKGASWDAVEKSMKLDQWFPFGLFSGLFAATLAGYVLLGVSDAGLD